jgi:hypothetical protein
VLEPGICGATYGQRKPISSSHSPHSRIDTGERIEVERVGSLEPVGGSSIGPEVPLQDGQQIRLRILNGLGAGQVDERKVGVGVGDFSSGMFPLSAPDEPAATTAPTDPRHLDNDLRGSPLGAVWQRRVRRRTGRLRTSCKPRTTGWVEGTTNDNDGNKRHRGSAVGSVDSHNVTGAVDSPLQDLLLPTSAQAARACLPIV